MKQLCTCLKKDYSLLFFAAILSALPLTFPSLFLLSWVSFVPFFLVILKQKDKEKFFSSLLHGAFFGFCYLFFVYFWFLWLYPLDFAGLDRASSLGVVLFAWFGISFAHGLSYAIPFLLCRLVGKKVKNELFLLFAAVLGILLAQYITSLSELAFPWVRVSLGNYRAPVLIQSVSLFGQAFLDFLMLTVSALVSYAVFTRNRKKRVLFFSLATALFLSNLFFGAIRVATKPQGETLSVSAVQGSVLSGEKWDGKSAVETYVLLTKKTKKSDLVVWPESAVPNNLSRNSALLEAFQNLSEEINTPILMGCFWELEGDTTNSTILLNSESVSAPYHKRRLVPFGEKMVYGEILTKILPALNEMNLLSSDYAMGTSSALMKTEKGKIGSIICFESIFPSITRQTVRDGAEMIVLVTNDSWYKDSPGVWQHLAHAVFRSVENSRSTVRCANSGVSALIDERGSIKKELGPLKKGVLEGKVSFSGEVTLYQMVGDVFLPALCFVFLFFFVLLLILERRKRFA